MDRTKRYEGAKMRELLPEDRMDFLKESFQDHNLDMEKDLDECCLEVNTEKMTAFLMHRHQSKNMNTGTCVAIFGLENGSIFYTAPQKLEKNRELHDQKKQAERLHREQLQQKRKENL